MSLSLEIQARFGRPYHRAVDAKPTIEALEAERLRLKELERNLARERNRVQESAAREVARMHELLRESASRASKREHELEKAQRKAEGGRGVGRVSGLGYQPHDRLGIRAP